MWESLWFQWKHVISTIAMLLNVIIIVSLTAKSSSWFDRAFEFAGTAIIVVL
jgi:hypothetical protein